jgi:acetyltransferase-like isoleucine patch superfamily enzyme
MTERERMERRLWYDANFDEGLRLERERAGDLAFEFNSTRPSDAEKRAELLGRLIGTLGENVEVLSPLYVDYGRNVSIGDGSFVNHGAYLMDGATIAIGAHVFIGPNFGAYTAQHPLVARERNTGLERALPITIGDDCWIGANVCVLPGVTIGAGCVIGAGSLVTKDVPAGWLAMGSPCRPVREITDEDLVTT